VRLSPLGTAATTGLLYQPQMMMVIVKQLVEWRLAGETEALGENLPSATLSTTNPAWPDPGSKPGRRGGRPATNGLSHGAAINFTLSGLQNYLKRILSIITTVI
jgi:hypothetical protein